MCHLVRLQIGVAAIAISGLLALGKLGLPASADTIKPPPNDLVLYFNPAVSQPTFEWRGKIVSYRVFDERYAPQRIELEFMRENATTPITLFVRIPLYVNSKILACSAPESDGPFRHDLHICSSLPAEFLAPGRTIYVRVWFVKNCADFSQVVPATDSISTDAKPSAGNESIWWPEPICDGVTPGYPPYPR